jgi:Zn-dependent peptidase ImmA (M78 family)/DNA-binding XRE family transcriptional regulator
MQQGILQSIDPALIGERIADARRERRLTQADLAEELGVARTTITAMEKGERRPRASELVKIARILDRSVRTLIQPVENDSSPAFAVQFRRSTAHHGDALVSDIRIFEQLCQWYLDLEELLAEPLPRRYPLVYDIAGAPPDRAAEEVASSERNRLGLGDGPVADLWGLLETDIGLRLLKFPMRDTSTAGMFLYSELFGGCIAINASHPPERQRWTAAHEFAHFLSDRMRPEISVLKKRSRQPQSERFADDFARCFLMPASGLIRKFEGMRRAKSSGISPADALILARHYTVSFEAMMLRLEELNLVPGGTHVYLKGRGFRPEEGKRLLGLDLGRHDEIGPQRYLTLCAEAFQRGDLSEGELAQRLNLSRVDARDAVQRLTTMHTITSEGEYEQGSLDLAAALVPER